MLIMSISTQIIGLLTCQGSEEYKQGDQKMIQSLAQRGFKAEHLFWDKPTIDWRKYVVIVVLSTWDYSKSDEHLDRFLAVLEKINACGVLVLNDIETIKWNCKKTYLKELERQGVPTIETLWLEKDHLSQLKSFIPNHWNRYVIKPVLCGGGSHTQQFPLEKIDQIVTTFQQLNVSQWMIQPFASEIEVTGEYSFIFIEKRFSHCVLKKPKPGSFMSGMNHGAINSCIKPTVWMMNQAQKIIDLCARDNLFTRLDAIARNNLLLVMEVENIEPYLYFEHCQGLEDQLADVIIARINKHKDTKRETVLPMLVKTGPPGDRLR